MAKLDFHRGSPQDHKVGRDQKSNADEEDFDEIRPGKAGDGDDEDEDEEEEEDNDDDSLTPEGGFIQALLRMQIQPRIKHWLPEFKHTFSDDIKMSGAFDCYGIHPAVPKLDFFKGGFILEGSYKEVPLSEEACAELPTNGIDFMALQFAPEILRAKVNQLDSLYDYVDSVNPNFASYIMKPSSVLDAYKTGGVAGMVEAFGERKDNFMKGVPSAAGQFNRLKEGLGE